MLPYSKIWTILGKTELQDLLWESTGCSSNSGKPTCAGLKTLQVASSPDTDSVDIRSSVEKISLYRSSSFVSLYMQVRS